MVARGKRKSAPPLEIQRIFAQPEGVRRSGSTSEGLLLNLLRPFRAHDPFCELIQGWRFAFPGYFLPPLRGTFLTTAGIYLF